MSLEAPACRAAITIAETVEDRSDGRIQILVLSSAQLGKDAGIIALTQFDAIQIGIPPTAKRAILNLAVRSHGLMV